MKRCIIHVASVLALSAFGLAQDAPPAGTHQSPAHPGAVRPSKKQVTISAGTVQAAQEKLAAGGYYSGPANGAIDAATRTAIRKYQEAEGLKVNGRLDQATLSHLNIGGGETLKAAPGDMGRGAKAAGYNAKEGHPIEAGKSIGEGTGRSAEKVGQGTKSTAAEGGSAIGEGAQNVGHGAKEGGKAVGHGAKEGAKKVGQGVKKGVKTVIGKDEKKPDTTPPPQE